MQEKLYGVVEKGPVSRVEVRSSTFHEKDVLHVREAYQDDDGEWKPTKKGFTLREGVQVEDLITALTAAKGDF